MGGPGGYTPPKYTIDINAGKFSRSTVTVRRTMNGLYQSYEIPLSAEVVTTISNLMAQVVNGWADSIKTDNKHSDFIERATNDSRDR